MAPGDARNLTRRAALRASLAGPLAAIAACRSEPPRPPGIVVRLADLPDGKRVRVLRGEEPVELLRRGDEVRARSLWCTHLGCEVAWSEAQGRYLCPCHEGEYDADGRAVAGPPPQPLPAVPFTRLRDEIVLAPRPQEPAGLDSPTKR